MKMEEFPSTWCPPRLVIPAHAGIQVCCAELAWIPAFAGMTEPRRASWFSSPNGYFQRSTRRTRRFRRMIFLNFLTSCSSCLRGENCLHFSVAALPRCVLRGETSSCTPPMGHLFTPFPILFERMFLAGKFLLAHFANELFDRGGYHAFEIRVAFDEFGRKVLEQAQHVMDHQHLPVALRPRANADGGDRQPAGNLRSQVLGHSFQHHSERPRLFHR